jgi:hypothetical protein
MTVKATYWPKLNIWYFLSILTTTVTVLVLLFYAYPFLAEVTAPLDKVQLPAAFLNLKLSSAMLGGFIASAVTAIPSVAHKVELRWENIANKD